MFLSTLDLAVVALYAIILFAIAQWVSREPVGSVKNTEDYFLAGKSLPALASLSPPMSGKPRLY